jgi:hypothetical protein
MVSSRHGSAPQHNVYDVLNSVETTNPHRLILIIKGIVMVETEQIES